MAEFPTIPPQSRRGTGYIYFLLARDNLVTPMLKIGFSLRRPDLRLRGCQTGSPSKLELICVIVGTMRDERALHIRFKADHSHGEWFTYSGDLQDYVAGLDL